MSSLRAMKAVYCYFFPEVRALLHEVERAVPDSLYLVTTPAAAAAGALGGLLEKPLEVPATPAGHVDLDALHEPVMERILKVYEPLAPGLSSFPYRYPTSGSSEGIFHLLVRLRTGGEPFLYVLEGEYEGYEAQAAHLGLPVRRVELETTEPESLEAGLWFLSNPSARDGNVLPPSLVSRLCRAGHRVILDLAYLGATAPVVMPVADEGVEAVVMSFSKPYGVFRSRIGGFAFARQAVPTLYGNKWFKDVLRLVQALVLAERLGPPRLWERYVEVQERIVVDLNGEFGLGLRASDSLLIAHLAAGDVSALGPRRRELIEPFRRGKGFRFCLTPYFEEQERGGAAARG